MFLAKKVRKTAVILIFSCFSILGWSSEQIKWSLSPSFGLINGKIGEYLYSSMNDRLLSYLEFNENTLPYISLGTKISHKNSNFIADVQYRIPAQCGLMTDSDWKIQNIKTNYGIFNNYTDYKNFNFNLGYGFCFNLGSRFYIQPQIQLMYRHYSFYTDIGYGWYGNNCAWNEPEATYYPKLSHINLIMQNYSLFIGIDFEYVMDKVKFKFNAATSPLMINYAIDFHADDNKNTNNIHSTYTKQISSFYAYKTGVVLEYKLSNKSSLTTGFDCLMTLVTKGPTGIDYNEPDEKFGLLENPEEWKAIGQNTGNKIFEFGFNAGIRIDL